MDMKIPPDFSALLELLNENEVRYLIVGGYAMAFHGVPRFTGDLDILVDSGLENASRVVSALEKFGFGGVGLTAMDFQQPGNVIQLGYPPLRIDFLNALSGVASEEAFAQAIQGRCGETSVFYISREHLIQNKLATDRPRDRADIALLGATEEDEKEDEAR